MNPPNHIPDARSGTDNENLQEILDAAVSDKHALQGGQQQYQTPPWLAKSLASLLPHQSFDNGYDPQCAGGNLLMSVQLRRRYGTEIDARHNESSDNNVIQRCRVNCVKFWETVDDVNGKNSAMKFSFIAANPPFGIRWKLNGSKDNTIDSTEYTWQIVKKRLQQNGCGYFIANADTIERLEINKDPWVYLYQRFPKGGIWDDCDVAIGVVHYINNDADGEWNKAGRTLTRYDHVWNELPTAWHITGLNALISIPDVFKNYPPYGAYFDYEWEEICKIIREEQSSSHSKWNIFLNKEGVLRTYLSTRHSKKLKREVVEQLARINGCRPITLTTEREPRKLLHQLVTEGVYSIEPAAKQAIVDALAEVQSMACPIRPVTPFEKVAYADEEDNLLCKAKDPRGKIALTPGKRYEIKTATYQYTEEYVTKKLYYDEDEDTTELREHDMVLHKTDRYIEVVDDRRHIHRFMPSPDPANGTQHNDSMLFDLFEEPYVPSVKEVQPDQYARNVAIMETNELFNSFNYFSGQKDYYARMGCKDYGLIAADVGTGKTLGALTMVALKSPKRTLIIAPQGTMRSSGDEEDIDYQASQWVQEIRRFAPGEPVFQIFSIEDWEGVLRANGGELPMGIFITYPQAYFSNSSFETLPASWTDKDREEKFCKHTGWDFDPAIPEEHWISNGVGRENKQGIRCIAEPNLHTRIEAKHGKDVWTMVIVDEAHLMCNIDAKITQNLLRVQPKYRFAMTATPIPNIISNIFSLMGWVCVPDWHLGGLCNAAWPYTSDDIGRFESTFLSWEQDKTAEAIAKSKGKKRPNVVRKSPIISSPARLLKLLKPSMAYISKEDCNPDLVPCEVIDVRVKTGKDQGKLYAHWLNRGNYKPEFKMPLTIAMVQSSRLRGVCACPASLDYTLDMVDSNFNPKTITILGLIRDCLKRGEQVVVVSARVGQSEEVAMRLAEAKVPIARIDSTTPAELHTAEANRFKRGDARVMIMGIKCAQGHSFDQCPNLIIGSLEWSYGSLHQAKGRVWRLTSPKPVKVWCVLHQGTIEEMLFDRVGLKQDAATICLRGQRVPRDYKPFDAAEVLAEHINNFDPKKQDSMSELECEQQWPELRKQLALTNTPKKKAAKEDEAA